MTDEVVLLPDAENPQQLRVNGRTVHSRNPQREARRQASEILSRSPRSVLLLSPGLGFVIDLLLQESTATLLYVEPNPQIRQAVLKRLEKTTAAGSHARSSRFIVRPSLPDLPQLKTMLPGSIEDWHIFFLKPTLRQEYADFIATLQTQRFRETVNRNTLKRFDRIWLKNLYYNFATTGQWLPVSSLFGKHNGQPAVVVSAGPSLDGCLPALAKNRSRYVLIAVDTAIAALRHYGLDPDYVLAVDAQAANFLHIRSYRGKATVILDATVCYLVLRHLRGPYYTFHNPLPAAAALLQAAFPDGPGELEFGGSVSTNAFDLAKKFGCSPIFLCGMDLSFPGQRIHARGSALEEAAMAKTHRLFTAHQQNHAQLTAIDRRSLINADGKTVPSNDKLLIFYEWYRSRLPDPHVIHVDGGGASFPGQQTIRPDTLSDRLASFPELSDVHPPEPAGATHRGILDQLDSALNSISQLLEQSPSADLANRLLEMDSRLAMPVLRLLSSGMQDRLLQQLPHSDNLEEFFADLRSSLAFHRRLLSRSRQIAEGQSPLPAAD